MGGRGQYVNRGETVGLTVTTGDGTVFEYRKKGKKVFSFSGHHLLIVEVGKFLEPYPI